MDRSGYPSGGTHFLITGEKLGLLSAPYNPEVYRESLDLGTDTWEKWYKEHSSENSKSPNTTPSTPITPIPEVSLKSSEVKAYNKDIKEHKFDVKSNINMNDDIKEISIIDDVNPDILGKQIVKLKVVFNNDSSRIVTYTVDVHNKVDWTDIQNTAKKNVTEDSPTDSNTGKSTSSSRSHRSISSGITYSVAKIDPVQENLSSNSNITRISGKNRIETSIETSKFSNSDTAVLVSSDKFADAISGQNLVNKYGFKLILVDDNTDLTRFINSEIKNIYIVGGVNSVSENIENEAKSLIKNVVRINGKNRYDTNLNVLKKAKYDKVAIADGNNALDALSAEGLLVKENIGLQIVDGSTEYKVFKKGVYTIGGKSSVVKTTGERISGKNRYETNKKINEKIGPVKTVSIADGNNFADALSASNIIKNKGGSILLTNNELNHLDKNM